jgi:hypothetical protein
MGYRNALYYFSNSLSLTRTYNNFVGVGAELTVVVEVLAVLKGTPCEQGEPNNTQD